MKYQPASRYPGTLTLEGDERFIALGRYADTPREVLVDKMRISNVYGSNGFTYIGEGPYIRADGTTGTRRDTSVALSPNEIPEDVRRYLHDQDVEDAARTLSTADDRQRIGRAHIESEPYTPRATQPAL